MTTADRLSTARQALTAVMRGLDDAARAVISDKVREVYPTATALVAYGEYNEDGLLHCHANRVTRKDGAVILAGAVGVEDALWDELTDAIDPLLDELSERDDSYQGEVVIALDDEPQPTSGPATTRPGFPEIWGIAEVSAYADQVADSLGKQRPARGRFWSWEQMEGFPAPLARLQGGTIWFADEVRPYVDKRLSAARLRTTPTDPVTKAGILNDYGRLTAAATATKHGVSASTVTRIWRGER